MTSAEQEHNPDRPGSYERYLAEKHGSLQAEDLFHYFNSDLFAASNKLELLKNAITQSEIPTDKKLEMLDLVVGIDKRHLDLQTIARDALKALASIQRDVRART